MTSFYKNCAVPMCKNTSISTPQKLFINVPKNILIRRKWLTLASRHPQSLSPKSTSHFCKDHFDVVGLARRKDRLNDIAKRTVDKKGTFYPLQADVARESDVINAFDWIKNNLGPVHVLINNAGITRLNKFTECDIKDWTDVLQVNVVGLCVCTREAIKSMKTNNFDGHIININSTLGHRVSHIPFANMYPPSKFAVTAINEVLKQELADMGSKIKVTSLSPGLVETDMITEVEKKIPLIKSTKENVQFLEPSVIAESVVYVLSTPSTVLVNELVIRPLGEIF